jgi:putative molybdopterin biosynthesis protein
MKQEQFLSVLSLEEAQSRWQAALVLDALPTEDVPLDRARGRVLGEPMRAPGDVPAFDRSNVDGFAVRASDTFGATEATPVSLPLQGGSIDAGAAPADGLESGCAMPIATGGMLPRAADAVVMVEDTRVVEGAVWITRPATPGQLISQAGSDIARGETILLPGQPLSARETGILAACGIDPVPCRRRPRVGILSTGDEIVAPGLPLAPGQVHDANATLLSDTVAECGGEATYLGIAPDDEDAIRHLLERARGEFDLMLLSGGTSKGRGDVTYRVLEGQADIIAHGVALKPGKPLCLGAWDEKPVVVLPGFPTSAIFTFHQVVAPVLRRLAGRAPGAARTVRARLARHQQSARGRTEFCLVTVTGTAGDRRAWPLGKGSGSVTTFSRADGFFAIPTNDEYVDQGDWVTVTLLSADLEPPDLLVVGSHCTGLDAILAHAAQRTGRVQVVATGSRGGIQATRDGACDVAPVHLLEASSGEWNAPFAPEGVRLLRGYGRTQGLAYRSAQGATFGEGHIPELLTSLANNAEWRIANRNPGSGTSALMDTVFGALEARPPGWSTAYRSHTAVATAIAQGRADYGICLEDAARAAGLDWRPWRDEQYDFLVPEGRWEASGVVAFRTALADPGVRATLEQAGFRL